MSLVTSGWDTLQIFLLSRPTHATWCCSAKSITSLSLVFLPLLDRLLAFSLCTHFTCSSATLVSIPVLLDICLVACFPPPFPYLFPTLFPCCAGTPISLHVLPELDRLLACLPSCLLHPLYLFTQMKRCLLQVLLSPPVMCLLVCPCEALSLPPSRCFHFSTCLFSWPLQTLYVLWRNASLLPLFRFLAILPFVLTLLAMLKFLSLSNIAAASVSPAELLAVCILPALLNHLPHIIRPAPSASLGTSQPPV